MFSAYHGHLSTLWDISAKVFKRLPQGKKKHVHLIPIPRSDGEDGTPNGSQNGGGKWRNVLFF